MLRIRSVHLASLLVFFSPTCEPVASTVAEPTPSSMAAASVGKSCPPLQARCGSVSRLMVTPRVSGLERSQEKSLEQHFPETVCPSTSSASFSRLPSPGAAAGPLTRPGPHGNSGRHNGSPPLSKPKPFLTLPGRSHSIYNINNRSDKCIYVDNLHSAGVIFAVLFMPSSLPSSQEQHPSQASFVCFSSRHFLILHATADPLHQGPGHLRPPAAPLPGQLRGPVHVLAGPASPSTSAPRPRPLSRRR